MVRGHRSRPEGRVHTDPTTWIARSPRKSVVRAPILLDDVLAAGQLVLGPVAPVVEGRSLGDHAITPHEPAKTPVGLEDPGAQIDVGQHDPVSYTHLRAHET